MKYKNKQLSSKQANKILKKWGEDAVFYAQNNNGSVYWNKKTGEILWYGDCEKSNVELLK